MPTLKPLRAAQAAMGVLYGLLRRGESFFGRFRLLALCGFVRATAFAIAGTLARTLGASGAL